MGETVVVFRIAVFLVTVPACALLVLFNRTFRLALDEALRFLLGLDVGAGCAGGRYLPASFRRSSPVSLFNAGSSPTTRALQT